RACRRDQPGGLDGSGKDSSRSEGDRPQGRPADDRLSRREVRRNRAEHALGDLPDPAARQGVQIRVAGRSRDGEVRVSDEGMAEVKLFTYWRSQAAFRVRVAMRLKGLPMEKVSLDLLAGDQFAADYQKLNPEGVVPTLIDDGAPLTQSLAILEYLDEQHPYPPLLPKELHARAHARAIAQMVAMDAHPFIVPRVRKYLEE